VIPEDLVPETCPWPIVLGIDPGTRRAGFGSVVVAPEGPRLVTCGVFAPPARLSVPERLARMQAELEDLLQRLRPETVAVESAFAARNVHSALRLGEARGMMIATAARRGARVVEYAPAAAKKAVLGNGSGSKEQVAAMVATLLGCGVLDAPHDATDALALALTHVQRMRLVSLTGAESPARRDVRRRP
jgi:crossover junction endodeoxyribonuclease RuvC